MKIVSFRSQSLRFLLLCSMMVGMQAVAAELEHPAIDIASQLKDSPLPDTPNGTVSFKPPFSPTEQERVEKRNAEFERWFQANENNIDVLKAEGFNAWSMESLAYGEKIHNRVSELEKDKKPAKNLIPTLKRFQKAPKRASSLKLDDVPGDFPKKSSWLKWAGVTTVVAAVAAIAGYVWWLKKASIAK